MPGVNQSSNHFFFEKDRKASFQSWPFSERQNCSITKMAQAGFYYAGSSTDDDTAACFLCGKVLDGWESTDDPWSEHKKHSPQCAFVKLGRPEDDTTVGEQLDLLDLYVQKVFDKKLDEAKKVLTELGSKARAVIQAKLKSND
ncbi:baculoviral IAP repeat-containing protein 5-like [Contarinia nasturtii]|uniref:baculoviral IAP repeat-containing protein 5-like n=1 Tax=Contarinia nasturtii TaxID=265458 RepID=UPI0012D4A363|nr:baculoviral IAP repeat-containing protein 5-like [Contarinia nasturtii]